MSELINNFYTQDFPSIAGKYCNLEQLNIQEHKLGLFNALGCNDEIFKNNLYGPFFTLDEFEKWLLPPNVKQKQLVILMDNEISGLISIHNLDYINHIAEIGVTFSLQLQNTRASTESIYLVLNQLFYDYSFRIIRWHCSAKNVDSINAARRLGFTKEMFCPAYYIYKNEILDGIYFSMLKPEWLNLQDRYIEWLSVDNFDENGQQNSSLNPGLIKHKSDSQLYKKKTINIHGEILVPDIDGLSNPNFIIEKLDLNIHAEPIFHLANKHPEMFDFKNYGNFKSVENIINFFKQFNEFWNNYCVFDENKEELLGVISLILISQDSRVVELYWLMVPSDFSQNKLFHTLFDAIEQFLFVQLNYLRIQVACILENIRELSLIKSFKFNCDGVFVNHFIHNQKAYDMAIFSKVNPGIIII